MAKLSLLSITQDILNDLDSDEVNSINDTIESLQIAQIVKTTFFELIASRNWPHLKRTVQLDGLSDTTKPTHLKLPELTKELVVFSYNKRKEGSTKDFFEEIAWLEPEQFLRKCNRRNVDNTNVDKITDFGGAPIYIRNDKQPEWFTSFDDEHVVLDSYNKTIESTAQAAQSQAIIYFEPSWTVSDTFIPDLPAEAFPALLEEAKSTAFVVMKQQANQKAEQKAQRQHKWLSRKAWRVRGGVRYPDFGRTKHLSSMRRSTLIDKEASVST